jgi:geranylgeranyl diphosphate synthase type I
VISRLEQLIISGVEEPKFLEILTYFKDYWKDFFRPTLTSLSCEAVGGKCELAEDAALIFTLASSGFGIHDDVIDKSKIKHRNITDILNRSKYRQTKMTIVGKYGSESALLVGNYLVLKAWAIFHEMIRKTNKPIKIADIIEVYGNLCIEICEAEFMETLCRRKLTTDLNYYQNYLWKAMAEVEACTRIGAMIANGKPIEVEALAEFGRKLGFNSRLADDIEDCLNCKGDLPHRIKNESVPLPLLYAAKYSKKNFEKIKNIIKKTHIMPRDVGDLLNYCLDSEAFEYIDKLAQKNEKEAAEKLSILKCSDARKLLSTMNKRTYDRVEKLCI